jgi:phosphoglycerate kinase
MLEKKTIKDIDLFGKKVLVRVDYNVPLVNGRVTDKEAWRIDATLDTIKYLQSQNAKVILMAHLGRPKGKIVPELSLKPVANYLSDKINWRVELIELNEGMEERVARLPEKGVAILENMRFYPGEKENDPELSKGIASLAEVFVMDGFAVAHRTHASVVGVAQYLPTVAGLLVEKEIRELSLLMGGFTSPAVGIIGGSKIETKVGVIRKFCEMYDYVIVAGGVANTIYKAMGKDVGKSLVDDEMLGEAKSIYDEFGEKIIISEDVVVAKEIKEKVLKRTIAVSQLEKDDIILDVGEKGIAKFKNIIDKVKTLVWNGPLGVYELKPFNKGTDELARYIARAGQMRSVVGGGDTVTAVVRAGLIDKFSLVSTGGGAMLDFLEGKSLPGIEVIQDKLMPGEKV